MNPLTHLPGAPKLFIFIRKKTLSWWKCFLHKIHHSLTVVFLLFCTVKCTKIEDDQFTYHTFSMLSKVCHYQRYNVTCDVLMWLCAGTGECVLMLHPCSEQYFWHSLKLLFYCPSFTITFAYLVRVISLWVETSGDPTPSPHLAHSHNTQHCQPCVNGCWSWRGLGVGTS